MKITKTKLKQIIKEEVVKLLVEQDEYDYDDYDYEEEELTPAQKIIKLLSSDDSANVEQGLTILDALEDQQLIDTIASHFVLSSDGRITIRSFKIPEETFWMILNYFAEKSDRVKNMLAQIESLDISNDFITKVDFLRFCTNLTSLELLALESLQNVDGLQGLTNLAWLNLGDCELLQNVNGLQGLTNLTTLYLSYCSSLKNVNGLKGCTSLTKLDFAFCESLQNVNGLQGLTNLTTLNLGDCWSLQNVDGLEGCTNLNWLSFYGSTSLPIKLQKLFESDVYDTAYEKFMKALNESKRNRP